MAKRTRKKALTLYKHIWKIAREYDGAEGYLGEQYCEERFRMDRTGRSTPGVDGYVEKNSKKYPVQVKFKWIPPDVKLSSRYVSVNRNAAFELLIVTWAAPDDLDVQILGVWKKVDVLATANPEPSSVRVYLTKLQKIEEFDLGHL